MKKTIKSLGRVLSKPELEFINGGSNLCCKRKPRVCVCKPDDDDNDDIEPIM